MISQAPVIFVVTVGLVYLLVRWQYSETLKSSKVVVDNKQFLIDTLQKRLDLQLVAATPSHIDTPVQIGPVVETVPLKSHNKLQFSTTTIIEAHQGEDRIYVEGKNAEDDLQLAVIKISNTLTLPEVAVTSVSSVRAQLFYREIGGPHKSDISLGAWVGTDLTYWDFGVGSSRLLIVAGGCALGAFTIENDYMEDHETYDPQTQELTAKVYEVIVQLMSGTYRNSELIGQCTLRLTTRPLGIQPISDQ